MMYVRNTIKNRKFLLFVIFVLMQAAFLVMYYKKFMHPQVKCPTSSCRKESIGRQLARPMRPRGRPKTHNHARIKFWHRRRKYGGEKPNVCPSTPPGLQGKLDISFNRAAPTLKSIEERNKLVSNGGAFKPDCISTSKVAIVIPYRNRSSHLRYFMHYMHPALQRQQLNYRIYVVNQHGRGAFNRAKLMNVGFREALKDGEFDCFVFHDVDLIVEDDRALYRCPRHVGHLSSAIDKFGYTEPYPQLLGGVTQMTRRTVELVNGFSNRFWGWGGEDDELYQRVAYNRLNVTDFDHELARYKMIPHERDAGNGDRDFDTTVRLLHTPRTRGRKWFRYDGLNTLRYKLIDRQKQRLYTNVTVDLLQDGLLWDDRVQMRQMCERGGRFKCICIFNTETNKCRPVNDSSLARDTDIDPEIEQRKHSDDDIVYDDHPGPDDNPEPRFRSSRTYAMVTRLLEKLKSWTRS